MKEKNWRYIVVYILYVWCAVMPLLAIFLDLFLTVILGDAATELTLNFDVSLINQMIYLSVWVTLATSIFGISNWINLHNKKMPNWITGKNAHTLILVANIYVFALYNVTMWTSNGEGIVGFNNWYKILKSIVEHSITPVAVLAIYALIRKQSVSVGQYSSKYCWYNLILPALYLIFIFFRAFLLVRYKNMNPEAEIFMPFPYAQLDPGKVGFGFVLFSVFASCAFFVAVPIGVHTLKELKIDFKKQKAIK
ncbi:hypothetical protein [Spiroplasma sp. BIUS-1]|uniref:hypothetical protein n=1 Tax=Spiroplasma sp. BIUS-1 TaxID=216964 RepID=UPI00139923A7|nr:hypothetical protein [Spiroplasma sp. BIUS-1]QHX36882.1 hypothetical protein SBIUS_v1c06290 [Spiroplasma sp. BIUS-1]